MYCFNPKSLYIRSFNFKNQLEWSYTCNLCSYDRRTVIFQIIHKHYENLLAKNMILNLETTIVFKKKEMDAISGETTTVDPRFNNSSCSQRHCR